MELISVTTFDIVILVLYILFIVLYGLKNAKSSDSNSYFLAGRSMPWWIVGLSLFAASISSTTLIGQSGDAYHTGLAVFNYNLTGVVIMLFFATFLLPLYIKSKIFTIPEFLERRYDRRSRFFFSALCIIGNIFLDAAGALYAAALIIRLIYPAADIQLVVFVFAVIAASYTIPGGLSSAIKTELIQAIVLIAGSVVLAFLCYQKGADYFLELFRSGDVLTSLVRPVDDAATPWPGILLGMPIMGLYFWANNQTLVQRVLSARSIAEGRKGLVFNGFLTLSTLFIIAIPGLIARDLFPGLERPDMVFPAMVANLMPVGLLALILAALLSALVSTLSAIMNATSTLFTIDFYSTLKPGADSRKQVAVGKIASLAVIVIAALWAPYIGRFGSLLKYYQEMLSYIAPPIVAAFILGIFNKRVNANGAFIGQLAGLAMAVLILVFKKEIFGDMHFLMIVPFLFTLSMAVIYIVSLFGSKPEPAKLSETVFSLNDVKPDIAVFCSRDWYKSYLFWALILLVGCVVIWCIFW